ncbi:hypothetical protein ROZALSC1DRAFT_29232 [Rozella allomycis CSF55]|uniref:DNA replication complex GINS protein PSF3 n=1 Tax=Rozella allomycis (strain CSF55) TaxID=988480 RepID=A0A075B461_ROZAC|nr:hypothetical protein O9G_003544 [Rozella allomycis CSF55]RKP19138.1 hypothetical protein ROZALSC1DRAFT_29232 [Rozella allomycis CSF55]|eukprot:EPZ35899.1 hypothetical protein O9G_003544 [Rozella allomycis CSF55]
MDANDRYFDIDLFLAEDMKCQCVPEEELLSFMSLFKEENVRNTAETMEVDIPLWLIETLQEHELVDFRLPKILGTKVQEDLKNLQILSPKRFPPE